MVEFIEAFLKEAAGQPLATFLCLVAVAAAIWWLVKERPASMKERKANQDQQHEDSVAIAQHIGCSNEVIRHSAAVIDNNTQVIANNTKIQELLQSTVQTVEANVQSVRDEVAAHNDKLTEILAIVRQK